MASTSQDNKLTSPWSTQSTLPTDQSSTSTNAQYGLSPAPNAGLNNTSQPKPTIPQAPSLSLPKGGGAIHGIGEKIDVAAATGASNISIPIRVSPGRSSFHPELTLQYSSGQGNSPFGLGWHLDFPNITRKTDKGLPRYLDRGPDADADVFLLANAEDLVPVFAQDAQGDIVLKSDGSPLIEDIISANYIVRTYRPRIEGLFSRIERWMNTTDGGDIFWRVISGNNVTSIYGKDDNSRIFNPLAASGEAKCIFSWLLSETFDDHGNAMVFTYKAEDSSNVDTAVPQEAHRSSVSRSAHRYLKTINYGNQVPNRDMTSWAPTAASSLPSSTWLFSVVLDYGEHDLINPTPTETSLWLCRQDPFSAYRSGFEDRVYRLCRRILIFHNFVELGSSPQLVNSMDLDYDENSTASKLTQCTEAGYTPSVGSSAPYIRSAIPPLQYEYTEFPSDNALAQRLIQDVDSAYLENIPFGVDGASYQWLDLYSEGLPGVFTEQAGGWFFARNSSASNFTQSKSVTNPKADPNSQMNPPTAPGSSPTIVKPRFDPLIPISSRPSLSVKDSQTSWGDVSGDGHLDLIDLQPGCWGFFEQADDPDGWTEFRSFRSYPNIPSNDCKLVDLTGDGLADLLIAGDQVYLWCESFGDEGYGEPIAVTQANEASLGPVSLFSDTEDYIVLADFSGDGLTDLVRIRNGDICYWPNMGYGRFGSMIRMANAPWFEPVDLFETKRVHLADVDGSGTTDMLYVHDAGVDIYLNQSGNGFSDRKRIESFPANDTLSTVSTVDLLGNGTTCLVWSTTAPQALPTLRYLDLINGPKPHLLSKMTNNMGTEKVVHYAPSTKFYLQDRKEGHPWPTQLPFPIYCVERIETLDRIGGNRLVSRYRYHDGFYDGLEREFRGFAMVERWDTDDFAESSTSTATNFDSSWHVPPVHTKTWYHTGVYIDNAKISTLWAHEYFGSTPGIDHNLLEDTVLPTTLTNTTTSAGSRTTPLGGDELREACRSLKGKTLRVEVYADDGTAKASLPYSISESNYTIEVVQPLQDANLHSIYFVHPREYIELSCEREPDDSRIQHEMTLAVDAYGNVLKSLKIVYGRTPGKSSLTGLDLEKQQTTLFLYSEHDVTNLIDSDTDYRVPIVYETRVYELSGLTPGQGSQFHFSDFNPPDLSIITSLPEIPFERQNSPGTKQKRLITESRMLYRQDDLTSLLPAGQISIAAIPGWEYRHCFTPGLLTSVFQRQLPGQPIESLLPSPVSTILAGTGSQQGGYVDLDGDGNWWQPGGRVFFHPDPTATAATELAEARSHFFSFRRFEDPFGNSTVVNFDNYDLFPTYTQDPIGNAASATIDYRVLAPALITDANGNRSAAAFDALGYVVGTAVMGKTSENVGDSLSGFQADLTQAQLDAFFANPRGSGSTAASLLGSATSRTIYDPNRYWNSGSMRLPIYTAMIKRETHVSDLLQGAIPPLQLSFNYADGFERIIQSKSQAKPGPLTDGGPVNNNRWTGSGWTIYNNKGQPVRTYEPFFDDTHDFKYLVHGVSTISFYDPVGRVVGALRPDKTLNKTRFDSWTQTIFDGNDNVLISAPKADPDLGPFIMLLPDYESIPSWYDARITGALGPDQQQAAVKTAAHANTPTILYLDVMGRTFMTVKDNGPGGKLTSRTSLDILGNQYQTYDAADRLIMSVDFDMTNNHLHQDSPDSGERWILADAGGQPLITWNSRGFRLRSAYDANRRLIESYVRNDSVSSSSPPEILVNQTVFGETVVNAAASNLCGKAYLVRDQTGLLTNHEFDFKGNLLRSERTFAQDYKDLADWSQIVALESETFIATTTYDALSRVVEATTPDQSVTYRSYNETGRLEQLRVNLQGQQSSDPTTWSAIITSSDYNERGQVKLISHGNGAQTNRTYDEQTFRLMRIQTLLSGATGQTPLQDLNYVFDPVGNITSLRDNAQQTAYFRNTVVDPSNDYIYDPIYRLISATGREHLGQTGQPNVPTALDLQNIRLVQPGDGSAMARYTESYTYDVTDNITKIAHAGSDATSPGWTRNFSYDTTSNHLLSTAIGSTSESYTYDINGNMTALPPLSGIAWNFLDQLQSTSKQIVNTGTPETTYYVYDMAGQRTRKVTERAAAAGQTAVKLRERLYIGACEVYRTYAGDGITVSLERDTLNCAGEAGRVALIETRTVGTDPSPVQQTRFQFSNFNASAVLELGIDGGIVSYEEYTPWGSTSYQAVGSTLDAPKRYRYTGKERDEESGLYYYGARYYASWLGRWTSCDPRGMVDGTNVYAYVQLNPINHADPTGTQTHDPDDVSVPTPPRNVNPQAVHDDTEKAFAQWKKNWVDSEIFPPSPPQGININLEVKYKTPGLEGKLSPDGSETKFTKAPGQPTVKVPIDTNSPGGTVTLNPTKDSELTASLKANLGNSTPGASKTPQSLTASLVVSPNIPFFNQPGTPPPPAHPRETKTQQAVIQNLQQPPPPPPAPAASGPPQIAAPPATPAAQIASATKVASGFTGVQTLATPNANRDTINDIISPGANVVTAAVEVGKTTVPPTHPLSFGVELNVALPGAAPPTADQIKSLISQSGGGGVAPDAAMAPANLLGTTPIGKPLGTSIMFAASWSW